MTLLVRVEIDQRMKYLHVICDGNSAVPAMLFNIELVFPRIATGIGIADDFLFGPLGAGIGKGLSLMFG